jgi:hypothetical protein
MVGYDVMWNSDSVMCLIFLRSAIIDFNSNLRPTGQRVSNNPIHRYILSPFLERFNLHRLNLATS